MKSNPASEGRQLPKTRLQKLVAKAKRERWEDLFQWHLVHSPALIYMSWQREYEFMPRRKFRFDFANTAHKIAIEIEGLVAPWQKSRHTTNSGYEKDCEKYTEAAILGWRVLRVTSGMVKDGRAIDYTERMVKAVLEVGL